MKTFHLYAATASGIEAIAGRELRELGYEAQVENGRVRFDGTIKDILRANLWLRTADRVRIIVAEFDAVTFDELFEATKAVAWDELLPMDAAFPVDLIGHLGQQRLHVRRRRAAQIDGESGVLPGDCRAAHLIALQSRFFDQRRRITARRAFECRTGRRNVQRLGSGAAGN